MGKKELTAWARDVRLRYAQAQSACSAVGRQVWRMDGDFGKLLVYHALKQMRRSGFVRRIQYSGCEVLLIFASRWKVADENRL